MRANPAVIAELDVALLQVPRHVGRWEILGHEVRWVVLEMYFNHFGLFGIDALLPPEVLDLHANAWHSRCSTCFSFLGLVFLSSLAVLAIQ